MATLRLVFDFFLSAFYPFKTLVVVVVVSNRNELTLNMIRNKIKHPSET